MPLRIPSRKLTWLWMAFLLAAATESPAQHFFRRGLVHRTVHRNRTRTPCTGGARVSAMSLGFSSLRDRPNFKDVRAASSIEAVVARYLPGGKRIGKEWVARNPTRADAKPGSFKVHLTRGYWSDFATKESGGDMIDLVAYLTGKTIAEAKDELAAMFAAGEIDGSQLKRGTNDLRSQLAGIDGQLGEPTRKSPAADLLKRARGRRNLLEKHWHALTADMKGKTVDELMTVTVYPAPRGRKGFDPDYVDIKPKAPAIQ